LSTIGSRRGVDAALSFRPNVAERGLRESGKAAGKASGEVGYILLRDKQR